MGITVRNPELYYIVKIDVRLPWRSQGWSSNGALKKEIIGRSDSDANMLGSMKGHGLSKKPMVEVDVCHPFSDQ